MNDNAAIIPHHTVTTARIAAIWRLQYKENVLPMRINGQYDADMKPKNNNLNS